MEQRKLIKLGNSSFAIALPETWVDKSGLKKGDKVFLEENGSGEINLFSELKTKTDNKTKILDFSGINEEKAMQREISTAYIQDYDLMEIKCKDKKQQLKVKELVTYLIGMEVIEENEEKIVAKDFFDLKEANISNFLKRIDNNIRAMLEELEEGIKTGKIVHKDFLDADHDINKFYFLINKILMKGINHPPALITLNTNIMTLFSSWWLAYNLEHIGDEIKRLARIVKNSSLEGRKLEEIQGVFSKIKEYYKHSINSYYRSDKDIAIKNTSKRVEIMNLADAISNEKEADIAKMGEKFKAIAGTIHQANKIIVYSL